MGPSVDRRQRPGGEAARYYSRLPAGRETYVARFGGDGKLIAIEQRLTRENAEKLVPKQSTSDDVLELFGPPYRKIELSRLDTQLWLYPMHEGAVRFVINVEFTADGRVHDVRLYDEFDDN
jgi:hypothetical protein